MKKTLVILLLILMVGCSKKYTKAPVGTDSPGGQSTEEMVTEEEYIEERIGTREDESIGESVMSTEEEARSVFKDVLFDFDQSNIRPDARPILDNVASFLSKNNKVNVVIEGHCDDRGTNEYNLALGEKRSKSAQSYLSSLGVKSTRMMILTYGEEKPLCTDNDEGCWQKNRRAHFVLIK